MRKLRISLNLIDVNIRKGLSGSQVMDLVEKAGFEWISARGFVDIKRGIYPKEFFDVSEKKFDIIYNILQDKGFAVSYHHVKHPFLSNDVVSTRFVPVKPFVENYKEEFGQNPKFKI